VVAGIAKDANDFYRIACTIGGYIVFPRNRPGQTGQTINQSGGFHPAIRDRFDLTLECIRRHYSEPAAENPLPWAPHPSSLPSPLSQPISRR
jgi:hypothetical protein